MFAVLSRGLKRAYLVAVTRAISFLFSAVTLTLAQTPDDLVENGRYNRAIPALEQRLKINPKDARTQYLIGKIRFISGDYAAAIKHLEEATQLDPNDAEYHALLGQLYGRQAQRASILKKFGLARKCKDEVEQAIKLDPTHLEANFTLMMYLNRAPGFIGGDKERAKTIPDQLARHDAAKAWMVRAQFASETDQRDKVEQYYRKAVEADPKNFAARWHYADTLINLKPPKVDEAEKQAKAAKDLNPQHITPYIVLAITYAVSDRFVDLDNTLKEAENIIPDNLLPAYSAARVLLSRGKELTRAEAYLRRYLERTPELGAPIHAHAYWSLGLIYEKLGRKSDAIAQLEKAVAQERDFEPAQKDLKRLRG